MKIRTRVFVACLLAAAVPCVPAIFGQSPERWPGSSGGKDEAERLLAEEIPPLSESDQRRYDEVALALVKAINSRDRETYRGLHTEEGWSTAIDWWRELFAGQIERFGKIEKAWAPGRGFIRIGKMGVRGTEGDGATFLVKFEEPVGGALTFELNEAGKIVATDVFVKKELGYYEPDGVVLIFNLVAPPE